MWESAKLLAKGAWKHWAQLVSGVFMALIGLVAGIRNWSVPPWVWISASAILVAWAVLKAFHDVRLDRDAAARELQENRNCQAIADSLTKDHNYGVRQLAHGDMQNPEWNAWVKNWNEGVLHRLKEFGCSPQDLERFETIMVSDLELKSGSALEVSMALHRVRLKRLEELIAKYAKRAEDLRMRCL